ncbi:MULTISPECIES: histidine phosphatase family protein [unclassified Arthrobacter]|uniref:histidine phosphatase family protein n=1 Tax=unclassified Arthrobacter TaxID=235627 RepID=UPI001D159F49|nr:MULTISPECIES: histidine phosphatase family protein [unclassified Arthrobacter]MCC3279039.1 histidine phosphatase family protein [Arthrobacter sp. zg-Y40]MCC9177414.1 histidine phosphatase family protein [Arthrobacter sp. zg-Y750]MCC3274989.1 histidine phosphatase family protein [Arthrobacter sp. zg-Y20]MDK1315146.1 histidine phosphatase family protein [Arthrobacter sp. zg.Y20]MDK1328007.1 histidine phosphatase family protein [Arthrobacter sp. zg-Y1143]
MSAPAPWDPGSASRRVVFWRHGRTEWNRVGRFQGQQDIALDPSGVRQAAEAAAVLRFLEPAAIVSSDLGRALNTGRSLGALLGLEVAQDKRLRETFAGTWEGRTFAQIGEQDAPLLAAWSAGVGSVRAGGGETRVDVGTRVAAAVNDAVQGVEPGGTLVVVSHGGAIRAGICALLGLPAESWAVISGVSNCHWSVLQEVPDRRGQPAWHLTQHNVGLDSLPTGPVEG